MNCCLIDVLSITLVISKISDMISPLPQGSYDEFSKEELIMIATGLDEVMPLIEEIENKVAVLNTKMERIENDFASIETNMTTSLSEKADVNHTHDDMVDAINNKSDMGHTHDDRYYTESEVNTKLAAKANSDHNHTGYAATSHTHTYASTSHNHDSVYAKTSHTHDAVTENSSGLMTRSMLLALKRAIGRSVEQIYTNLNLTSHATVGLSSCAGGKWTRSTCHSCRAETKCSL